ncbi:MAG: MFS transporter [Gammaproteobacteria bacterium]|nr:MFS transporter [Gammaproteobacteria bacterium]
MESVRERQWRCIAASSSLRWLTERFLGFESTMNDYRHLSLNCSIKKWLPALTCMNCQLFGVGLFSIFSFFVQPVAKEFGVGVGLLNTGAVFVLVAPALIGPVLGHFADTVSIRNIMLVGTLVAMPALLVVSVSQTVVLLAVAFLFYAAGQALYGPIVVNALLIRQYPLTAGRALAIAALGHSLGPVVLPFVAATLLDIVGWREGLRYIAVAVGLILLTTVLIGIPPGTDSNRHQDRKNQVTLGNRQFLSVPAFWIIGISISLVFNAAMLVNISYAPHFSKLGFGRADIATFIASGGLAGLTAKVLVGIYLDACAIR